jgi:hypothetical protein
MSWSSRRRTAYTAFTFLFLLIAAGAIFYFFFYEAPTCFDGRQNGDEAGVDCGGACPTLCAFQTLEPVVLWSRAFRVTDGVYNALAYVENPNGNVGIQEIAYTFKIFDERNILIAERKGKTFISPNGISPVFEGGIATGVRIPAITFFELDGTAEWTVIKDRSKPLDVENKTLSNTNAIPRIDATLRNNSVNEFSDIEIIAVVFDLNDNAMASSKTFVNFMPKKSSQNIVFTWPQSFPSSVSRVEIIPRIPVMAK